MNKRERDTKLKKKDYKFDILQKQVSESKRIEWTDEQLELKKGLIEVDDHHEWEINW